MCTGMSRLPVFSGSFSSCRSSSHRTIRMGRLLEVPALSGGLSQWRHPHPGKGSKRQSACTTDRNGGNKLQVEYALVDDVEQMDRLRTLASERMDALAACGIYPDGYDAKSFQDLKRAEETVRPDMLFCGAPHLLIPHAPADVGCGWQDTAIASTYFELLCAAHELGAILMSFCLDVLKRMLRPELSGRRRTPPEVFPLSDRFPPAKSLPPHPRSHAASSSASRHIPAEPSHRKISGTTPEDPLCPGYRYSRTS